MKIKYIPFEQPIGEFAMSVMSVNDILSISKIDRLEFNQISLDTIGGPQREASTTRINEITKYSESSDATFPTPILLSLPENSYQIDDNYIELEDNRIVASIVDGQHRILGLKNSMYRDEFNLPVVFILDATEEQKALIFAIINGKQTRVSASIIYELFRVVDGRNPFKSAHEIARALNQNESSPFYRRLKMLGKKFKGSNESLSQGTFVTFLVKLISNKPDEDLSLSRSNIDFPERPTIFNEYFRIDRDDIILKILTNLFNAIKKTFPIEWEDANLYILSKTTGYTGVIKSLPQLYEKGSSKKQLDEEFFISVFSMLSENLRQEGLELTSKFFPPNSIGENMLKTKIIEALNMI